MTHRTVAILIALIVLSFGAFWFLQVNKEETGNSLNPSIDTIMVGTNTDFPPFSFIENNQIVGFDIDVMQEIAKRLNKKMVLHPMSFAALIPELQLGTIHTVASGMTPSPERAKRIFFTTPHFTGDPLMALQKEGATPITKTEQLAGKTIAVNQGYSADNYLTNVGNLEIVRLSSPLVSLGLLAIGSGQADVYIASYSSLQPFLATQRDKYTISTLEGTAESSAIAISKKYPHLFSAMEKIVSDMLNDGTIEQLKKKWKLNA